MLSHLDHPPFKQPLKYAHKRGFHRHRLIQIFAESCAFFFRRGCAIAFLGLVLFKSGENFPTVFPQKNAASYTTQSLHRLSKQPRPREILKESRVSRIEEAELQTGLYDLDGNLLGAFLGTFQETTPDGQGVITYADSEGHSYISSLDGTESKALAGVFQGFTPSGQQMITYQQTQSHLYDLRGTLIASLDGLLRWSRLDGQYLVTDIENGRAFNLYSADGTLQTAYEGNFRGFAPYTPQLITTDRTSSYLYNFDGTLASTFDGEFQEFSSNGESLVTLTDQPSLPTDQRADQRADQPTEPAYQSHLYDLDGTLQASMAGEFAAFTPIEMAIITDTQSPPQSWLYGPNGIQQSAFEGAFISFTPEGQAFFTYSDGISQLYHLNRDLNRDDQPHFAGALLGITTNAQHLVTADPIQSTVNPQSWLYNIDGTKLADLDGIFIGFISDEQRIVTAQTGIEGFLSLGPTTYSIYDLAGNLETTLTGQLLGLTQSGRQGLVMYAGGKTRLYDSFEGTEQAVFEGRVLGFTRDETGVFINVENTAEGS